jgi:hypothetical protein
MAALGGKRENGVPKEKRARNGAFLGGNDVAAGLARRDELMDRQTRKREAEKKSTRMATRGGRIVRFGGVTRCLIIRVWSDVPGLTHEVVLKKRVRWHCSQSQAVACLVIRISSLGS